MSSIMLERSGIVKRNLLPHKRNLRDKISPTLRHLWPWRDWMTIGIGLLGASDPENHKSQDVLILVTDTLGSFGHEYSTERLHKTLIFRDEKIYVVCADDVTSANELACMVRRYLVNFQQENRGARPYGLIAKAIEHATEEYKLLCFRSLEMPKLLPGSHETYDRTLKALRSGKLNKHLFEKLNDAWEKFDLGCVALLGCYADDGRVYLFQIESNGTVHKVSTPGFAAIGAGGNNAMFWLSYRNHHLGMPIRRAAYHAYEAKLMAEKSPYVNEAIEFTVVTSEQLHTLTYADPSANGCPVSLIDMRELFNKLGPKETDALDQRSGLVSL